MAAPRKNPKKRTKSGRGRRRRAAVLAVAVVYCLFCLVFVFALGDRRQTWEALNGERFAASARLASVRAETASLKADRALLSDDSYLAILAREKLGYIFPGEKKVLFGTEE